MLFIIQQRETRTGYNGRQGETRPSGRRTGDKTFGKADDTIQQREKRRGTMGDKSCLPLSSFVPSCFLLMDGVFAFSRVLSPFVSHCRPFLLPFVGWCVCLSEGFVSLCLPLCPFLLPVVGWCVRLPEGLVYLCLPL